MLTYAACYDSFDLKILGDMFGLSVDIILSLLEKMKTHDELKGYFDPATGNMILDQAEMTRLETRMSVYGDKVMGDSRMNSRPSLNKKF